MSAPYVSVTDDHQLFVRDWGIGSPILLLAGWAMDSRVWGETMLALNDLGHQTIAYDRRGHGRSTDPGIASLDLLADDLAAVVDSLDLQGVTIVAHSGAAAEAIRYVSRHGAHRIARLIFVGGTGPQMLAATDNLDGIPAEALPFVLDQLANRPAQWVDENAEPFAPGSNQRVINWLGGMILDTSRRIMIDFQRIIAETDLRTEAAKLTLPVTLIHGDLDASAPIDLTAKRYATLIPEAELLIYEGVAHGVMVTDSLRLAQDISLRAT